MQYRCNNCGEIREVGKLKMALMLSRLMFNRKARKTILHGNSDESEAVGVEMGAKYRVCKKCGSTDAWEEV